MRKNDLINALREECMDIQIPELTSEVRQTPITIIPIEIRPVKKKKSFLSPIFQVFLVFALSLGIFYSIITKAETKVSIDINPSIEFTVNGFDKVIAVRAYNDQGEEFLQRLNIGYCTTDEAIKKIIFLAEELNYLDDDQKNALLYSVSTVGANKYKFEGKLKRSLTNAFSNIGAQGELHTVEFSCTDEEEAISRGVSPAKFAFIRELYAKRMKRDCKASEIPDELMDTSVTDLVTQLAS